MRHAAPPRLQFGPREFEAESEYLTLQLEDSNALLDDVDALRARLQEQGYLLVRQLHDREEVLGVRREMLERMASKGHLDPRAPLMDGVAHPDEARKVGGRVQEAAFLRSDSLRALVYGPRIMGFFRQLFGAEPLSYQFQFLRTPGPGSTTPIHSDAVFMGRGTPRLLTCWTPLGDFAPDMGPLVLCLGSNKLQQVIDTYGRSDVDRDLTAGYFSTDPAEMVEKFGCRWATTESRAGDVIVLTMHMMHASLTNTSSRYRLSCDTRYQPAHEPVDERWAGDEPRGHPRFWAPDVELEPIEVSRRRWGV